MFKDTVVNQIRDLLRDTSMSHRKVAKLLGVSRATVGRVARNERLPTNLPSLPPHPLPTDLLLDTTAGFTTISENPPFLLPCGPYQKCPSCGRRVKLPCLACQLEFLRVHLSDKKTVSVTSSSEYPAF